MSHAITLIAGLIVGVIVGTWIGLGARVWRTVYEEWQTQKGGAR